jgi:hypothetical protein
MMVVHISSILKPFEFSALARTTLDSYSYYVLERHWKIFELISKEETARRTTVNVI